MSSVPAFLPLYATLYDKSEQRIDEFLAALQTSVKPYPTLFVNAHNSGTAHLPTLQNEERLLAYAFLVSRSWHVAEAVEMAKQSFALRSKLQLDSLRLFPPAISVQGFNIPDVMTRLGLSSRDNDSLTQLCTALNPRLNVGYHSFDRRGLPVVYWMLSSVNVRATYQRFKELVPVGKTIDDVADLYTTYLVEVGHALCRYQDKVLTENPQPGIEVGAPRRNFVTVVIDAKDVGYKKLYKPAIDVIRAYMKRMNSIYPDCIHRVLVVNCSSTIKFLFNIVKPALNDGLIKKVVFVSPEGTPAALDAVIGLDRVPAAVGGRCNCPGGCFTTFNPNAVLSATEDGDDVVTEYIKLQPGEKHQKVFEMIMGEDVIWDFVSTKGVDVRFSVYFYPKQDGIQVDAKKQRVRIDKSLKKTTMEDPLVKFEKLTDGADHYLAPQDGILQLVWDNSKSLIQEKPIQMRVFKAPPLTEDA